MRSLVGDATDLAPVSSSLDVTKVCSWCGAWMGLDEHPHEAGITHSMCAACMAKIIAQVDAVQAVQDFIFPCPSCPQAARPYRVTPHGALRTIFVRCQGCNLAWTESLTA